MKVNKIKFLSVFMFSVHVLFCCFIASSEQVSTLENIAAWLTDFYGNIGFHWSGKTPYIMSSGIISALFCNVICRALEGVLLGWPRFAVHDKDTFIRAGSRAFLYIIFVFFVFGASVQNDSIFIEKYPKSLDFIKIFLISISTFLLGGIVSIADDAIASLYIFLRR